MNFENMPELKWLYGYPMALTLILISAVAPYLYLKKRGWI
jgi:magnesium transporter